MPDSAEHRCPVQLNGIGGNVGIGVLGTGGYLPQRVVGNDEVAATLDIDGRWIEENTGIVTRRAAAPHEAASDLAAHAARAALADAGIAASELTLLVLATSTPDELGPSTACRVQALIGAENAVAFDVSAACAGWLFGVQVARRMLGEEPIGRALVIGVEVYSKFLDPYVRGATVLFGDGAGACVLGAVEPGLGLGELTLGSDGTRAGYVLIPAGGSRMPACEQSVADRAHTIRMRNREVRDFITERLPALAHSVLACGEADLFVPHQPNPKLIVHLGQKLGFGAERMVLTSTEVGNIGAASIPFSLAWASRNGRLAKGDRVLMATIGAGMTWGAGLLTWSAG